MRLALLILVLLLGALQYKLWVGDGSLVEVWGLERSIDAQRQENGVLAARNRRLDADVRDLKEGLEAIEDRARHDLGMVRRDETFYQIVEESDGDRN